MSAVGTASTTAVGTAVMTGCRTNAGMRPNTAAAQSVMTIGARSFPQPGTGGCAAGSNAVNRPTFERRDQAIALGALQSAGPVEHLFGSPYRKWVSGLSLDV